MWVRNGCVEFEFEEERLEGTRHGLSASYVGWLNVLEARATNGALGSIGEEGRGVGICAISTYWFHDFSYL